MNLSTTTVLPVVFPIISCFLILAKPFKDRTYMRILTMALVCVNTVFTLSAIYYFQYTYVNIFEFSENLKIAFKIDGLSKVFGTMVALLWPATTLYAFEYMSHEKDEQRFFTFFVMSFGVTVGVAFAANMLTMYLFYEFLTLATLPLVMHEMDAKAFHAGKMYIIFMMSGAAMAFIGLVIIICYGNGTDFFMGGMLNYTAVKGNENILRLVYVITFFGFGVKAAVFPLFMWLPTASVAPTPVTALLHAVAVVKAGAFAIIRLTYFSYGTLILRDTWAQYTVMCTAMITILIGSAMALKTSHIKRRLAYSTISNLSYILFSVSLMTQGGLASGLLHMVYHAVIKITLFFCTGAVLVQTGRQYVREIEGIGTKMPIIFGCFTVCGFGLVGVPPFAGFHSKWNIAVSAIRVHNPFAYAGIFVIIVSALLTALYIFTILIAAYFPKPEAVEGRDDSAVKDPGWMMKLTIVVLTIATVVLGFFPTPLLYMFDVIASGFM